MNNLTRRKVAKRGFTLVELLIVIGVIAVLAAFAFVALNPLARFQDARNAQRWTDVNAVIAAIKLHQIDNGGTYLADIDDLTADLYYQIGAGESCNDTCSNPTVILQTACLDLSELVDNGYLASIPIDPNASGASVDEVRYYFSKQSTGALVVGSCSEEIGSKAAIPAISVAK
ncbi:type II secretion system protein [Candidatus Parcubacteria bacterium]|nr:type II secretion system protein [Candidatus Parcubacteria bacterium]